jgi:hypothetical protein
VSPPAPWQYRFQYSMLHMRWAEHRHRQGHVGAAGRQASRCFLDQHRGDRPRSGDRRRQGRKAKGTRKAKEERRRGHSLFGIENVPFIRPSFVRPFRFCLGDTVLENVEGPLASKSQSPFEKGTDAMGSQAQTRITDFRDQWPQALPPRPPRAAPGRNRRSASRGRAPSGRALPQVEGHQACAAGP